MKSMCANKPDNTKFACSFHSMWASSILSNAAIPPARTPRYFPIALTVRRGGYFACRLLLRRRSLTQTGWRFARRCQTVATSFGHWSSGLHITVTVAIAMMMRWRWRMVAMMMMLMAVEHLWRQYESVGRVTARRHRSGTITTRRCWWRCVENRLGAGQHQMIECFLAHFAAQRLSARRQTGYVHFLLFFFFGVGRILGTFIGAGIVLSIVLVDRHTLRVLAFGVCGRVMFCLVACVFCRYFLQKKPNN